MRIIAESKLRQFAAEHADAGEWLEQFIKVVRSSEWKSIQDVRAIYPHADAAIVASARVVTVFNVKGNRYRLVMAMHYNTGLAYVLRFMTHAEYSKNNWSKTL